MLVGFLGQFQLGIKVADEPLEYVESTFPRKIAENEQWALGLCGSN